VTEYIGTYEKKVAFLRQPDYQKKYPAAGPCFLKPQAGHARL
jgi:hypothetical protein